MGTIASQITSLTIVYSTVNSGADQRKHQRSALLAFVQGIHRGPVNSLHKGPVTRKMFHLMTSSCHSSPVMVSMWCLQQLNYVTFMLYIITCSMKDSFIMGPEWISFIQVVNYLNLQFSFDCLGECPAELNLIRYKSGLKPSIFCSAFEIYLMRQTVCQNKWCRHQ